VEHVSGRRCAEKEGRNGPEGPTQLVVLQQIFRTPFPEWLANSEPDLEVNRMKRLIFVLCLLGLAVSTAVADVPDPSNCQSSIDALARPRLLLIPNLPVPEAYGASRSPFATRPATRSTTRPS